MAVSLNQVPAGVRQLLETINNPTAQPIARENAKQVLEAVVILANEAIASFNTNQAKRAAFASSPSKRQTIRVVQYD